MVDLKDFYGKRVLSFRICIASRDTITVMPSSNLRRQDLQIVKNRLYQLANNTSGGGRHTEGARVPSTAERNGAVIGLLD